MVAATLSPPPAPDRAAADAAWARIARHPADVRAVNRIVAFLAARDGKADAGWIAFELSTTRATVVGLASAMQAAGLVRLEPSRGGAWRLVLVREAR